MTSNLLSLAFCCGRGNVIHSPNLILFIFFLGHTEDIFPSFPCSEVWPYSHTLANEESWLCPFWAQVAKSQCTFLQAPPLRLLQGSYRPCMPAGIARVGHLLTESCWRETHNLHFTDFLVLRDWGFCGWLLQQLAWITVTGYLLIFPM